MKATVSVPPAHAYGADEVPPSNPEGMSIEDAIYHTVHSYPGGVAALAGRMGMSANTLTHKANPNTTTHNLHPRELVTLQHMSGNVTVLRAMAEALGQTVQAATPDQYGGDPVQVFMELQVEFAEFVRSVADPLNHDNPVNRNEMRRAEYQAAELQARIGHMLAALRGRMRQAPGGL